MMRELFLRDLSLWTCLWQSSVFAGLGLIAGWLLRQRPARAYQVLLLAMTTAVTVPLLSAAVKHFDLGAFVARPTELSYALPEMPFAMPDTAPDAGAISRAASDAGATQPAPPQSMPAGVVEPAPFRIPWQVVLRYGWLAVTLALLGRLVATFLYGVHLVRHASRVPCNRVQRAVENAESKLAISWGLKVRVSRRIHSPLVWCWSRPSTLLVPEACDDAQVDWAGVVVHEMAHCKRRDHITGLVAELAASLLPWNPLMWLSRRMLIRLGEQACDDWVVASGQSSEDYAESLLHFRPQKQPAFWQAVVSSQGGLAHRIRRILNDACADPRSGARWALTLGLVAIFVGVGVAFAQTRPAVPEASTKPEEKSALSLHQAAAAGNLEQVNKLLAQGADVHAKDEDGRTPLHRAAWHGRKDVVEVLLARGANVNEADGSGQTPLHSAANSGGKPVTELLLAHGAQIHARDKAGNTPLHAAADQWYVGKDLLEFLIAKGANVKARNEAGQTPLHRVSMIRKLNRPLERTAEVLLALGAEIDAKDKSGRTPLHFAVEAGQRDLVNLLLAKGADIEAKIDAKDRSGYTPLHFAVANGSKELVDLLLAKGADIEAKNAAGRTALHMAMFETSTTRSDIVELLVNRGADVNSVDPRGITPLHLAAGRGATNETVERLIAKGADVNAKAADGAPALLAAMHGHRDTVTLLLSKGADTSIQLAAYLGDLARVKGFLANGVGVNPQDANSVTPLSAAARGGQKEVAEFLLSKGALVNADSAVLGGGTPLHCAAVAGAGSKEVAELLIEKGAEIDAKDKSGSTPLYYAAGRPNTDTARLLIAHGADVNAKSTTGFTPLYHAVRRGSKDLALLLLDHGADVNPKFQDDWTPLHYAAWSGSKDLVLLLLDRGADVNAENAPKWRPLDYAVRGGHKDVAKLLIDKGADTVRQDVLLFQACRQVDKDMAELLIRKGANVNSKAWGDGDAPALEAIWFGYTKVTKPADVSRLLGVLELLLDNGADPDTKDRNDWSLLHYACGNLDLTRLLLDRGANPNVRTSWEGLTPLHFVADKGDKAVTQLLLSRGADVNAKSAKDFDEHTPLSYAESPNDNIFSWPGKTPLTAEAIAAKKEVAELLREHGAKE